MTQTTLNPELKFNLPSWPYFAEDEIEAATEVLKSGKVNAWTGALVNKFESAFSNYVNCKYGIALANGTLALELALYALDIGPGDEVIVPCRTFIATASAVVARGAKPVVADIDINSQNISAETIKEQLSPKTKAIIVVHLAGWPCDMDSIVALAKENNLKVIEDCAQAHGAEYKNKPIGSFGDMSAFSFCQDKIMTTGGEGGMLVTNNKSLWEKAWSYKDHGKDYDSVFHHNHPPGFRWLHQSFGSNYRMTEMQAAIGLKQLEKLPQWIEARNINADILRSYLKDISYLSIPEVPKYIKHAYYKFYAFVDTTHANRDQLMQKINQQSIPCMAGICPEIYLEKAFIDNQIAPKQRFPVAQKLGETSMMFQVHPTITERHMHEIGRKIIEVA